MAFAYNWSGEGQTNGTVLTTVNSGAGTDKIFDAQSGSTLTADNAHPASTGVMGMKYAIAAGATCYFGWNLAGLATGARLFGRTYWYADTSVASSVRLIRFLAGTTPLAHVFVASGTNHVGIRNNADTNSAEGTVSMTINTLYRIEFDFNGIGTAAGAGTISLYAGQSTTVLDTVSGTGLAFGAAAPDNVRIGNTAANFVTTGSGNFWLDGVNVNDTAVPGPEVLGGGGPVFDDQKGLWAPAGIFDPQLNSEAWY